MSQTCYAPTEETDALRDLRHNLNRSAGVTELLLAPLDTESVSEVLSYLGGRTGDEVVAARLRQATGGNPFFLLELLRMLLESDQALEEVARRDVLPLSDNVHAAVEVRLSRLSRRARQVLDAGAVLGPRFSFDLVRRTAGRDEMETVDALDELIGRQMLTERPAGYQFWHEVLRTVVYGDLTLGRRRLLHRRAGEALEALNLDDAAALARHFERAGSQQIDKAIDYLLQAGDQARGLYARDEAVDYYERALMLLREQGDDEGAALTLMKLGLTYHAAFEFGAARRSYAEGFALRRTARSGLKSLPSPGHALRVDWGDPTTLDPTVAGEIPSAGLLDQLFSGLVELSPEMNVVPDVAKSWEVAEDGRRYVFYLRDDVRWSNGIPVTAGDFEYAWKRVLHPATESVNAGLLYDVRGARAFHQGEMSDADRVGVQAVDDGTLVIELEAPVGAFPLVLTCCAAYPIPQHVVEARGGAWTDPAHLVTNGPFRLSVWQRGESMQLTRNPEYRGRFSGNVQQVELSLIEDRAARLAMYQAGDLDVLGLWEFPPLEWDHVREHYARHYVSTPRLHTMYVGFDVSRPPFDDLRVRRAFVHGTDREGLATSALRRYYAPATGGFIPRGMPEHSPEIGLPYDPALAQRLLAQAGYPDGGGFPEVTLLAFHRAHPWGDFLKDQWREVLGVDIRWQVLDVESFLIQVEEQRPLMHLSGWLADYPDPDYFLRGSPHLHRTQWQDERYLRLVRQARRVMDQAERIQMYQQADRILIESAAIMPLTYGRSHLLIKPWVRQYPTSATKEWFWKDVVIDPH